MHLVMHLQVDPRVDQINTNTFLFAKLCNKLQENLKSKSKSIMKSWHSILKISNKAKEFE